MFRTLLRETPPMRASRLADQAQRPGNPSNRWSRAHNVEADVPQMARRFGMSQGISPIFRLAQRLHYTRWRSCRRHEALRDNPRRQTTSPYSRSQSTLAAIVSIAFRLSLPKGSRCLPQFASESRGIRQANRLATIMPLAPSRRCPSAPHAAANWWDRLFSGVRVRRIQHNERQQIILSLTPSPREFVAIKAVPRNIRGLSDR